MKLSCLSLALLSLATTTSSAQTGAGDQCVGALCAPNVTVETDDSWITVTHYVSVPGRSGSPTDCTPCKPCQAGLTIENGYPEEQIWFEITHPGSPPATHVDGMPAINPDSTGSARLFNSCGLSEADSGPGSTIAIYFCEWGSEWPCLQMVTAQLVCDCTH